VRFDACPGDDGRGTTLSATVSIVGSASAPMAQSSRPLPSSHRPMSLAASRITCVHRLGYGHQCPFISRKEVQPSPPDGRRPSRSNILSLFDKKVLEASFVSAGPTAPVGKPVAFDVFGYECIQCSVGDARAIFAPLKAS
jgi:hypothetical protein